MLPLDALCLQGLYSAAQIPHDSPAERYIRTMFNFLTGYVMGERSAARAATYTRGAAASSAALGQTQLGDLNDRIDRMLLVMDALWDLLKEQGYTDEQLMERIRTLDSADGTLDGKRTPTPVACPKCKSMIAPGRETSVFCGAASPAGPDPLSGV